MKYKFHDEKVLHRIKPWVYLSTYILLLAFFLMHVQDVVNGFDFVLSLFRSLLYAIVFAYVLNLPMKKIESFIIQMCIRDRFKRWFVYGISVKLNEEKRVHTQESSA